MPECCVDKTLLAVLQLASSFYERINNWAINYLHSTYTTYNLHSSVNRLFEFFPKETFRHSSFWLGKNYPVWRVKGRLWQREKRTLMVDFVKGIMNLSKRTNLKSENSRCWENIKRRQVNAANENTFVKSLLRFKWERSVTSTNFVLHVAFLTFEGAHNFWMASGNIVVTAGKFKIFYLNLIFLITMITESKESENGL